jgi:hypothetical protein
MELANCYGGGKSSQLWGENYQRRTSQNPNGTELYVSLIALIAYGSPHSLFDKTESNKSFR